MMFGMPDTIPRGYCMSGRRSGMCDGLLMSGSSEAKRKRIRKRAEWIVLLFRYSTAQSTARARRLIKFSQRGNGQKSERLYYIFNVPS